MKIISAVRYVLSLMKRFRNSCKRMMLLGRDVDIHSSVAISWTASINPARGRISIGRDSSVDNGAILRAYGGFIEIGTDCTINPYSVLYGPGGITIGNGVRIAPHVVIVASNHIISDVNVPIFFQDETREGILIEDDVWLGAGVRVLDGVTIRKGCVVGAGAVVTKSTEPFGVYVGCPARLIRFRA